MSTLEEKDALQLALQRRIQELEEENRRLSEALEERKERASSLRENELRYRTMADETPFLIWVTDAGGKIEFINKAYSEFFGVSLEQVQERDWHMLLHPDDQTAYVETYMACLQERKHFRAQARIRRRDGRWRWVISEGQPRFSESGTFLGMAGSSVDVTEHIETAEALRESETKFRSAFENTAIGYALQTPEGRFLDANAAYCSLVGYSIDELRKIQLAQLLHPEDCDRHLQLIDRLVSGEIPNFVVESRYFHKSGNVVWVRKSCSLVTDENEKPKWMVALIEDITEQKRTVQSLRESEKLYRAIGEAIPYGIWICDPEGRNVYASQSYLDLVGITQEQCSEFGWGNTLHPDDAERTIAAWKECVRNEGIWDIEHRFLGTDGQYHPILARGVPVRNEQGKIIYWAGINLDISRIKKAEQAMLENKIQIELQRRLMMQREQERLSIAQEIHDGPTQTLAAMMIGLQMAKDQFGDPAFHTELDKLDSSIRDVIRELRSIIAELRPPLLQFSGFSQAIQAYADDFRNRYPDLQLTQEIADDQGRLPEEACLSLFRIYQEALNNVIRHSGATQVHVLFSFADGMAAFSIADNGQGMELKPDLIRQTEEGHYGLAGMKERAEAVGGEFELQSTLGKGTTILVKIPVKTV